MSFSRVYDIRIIDIHISTSLMSFSPVYDTRIIDIHISHSLMSFSPVYDIKIIDIHISTSLMSFSPVYDIRIIDIHISTSLMSFSPVYDIRIIDIHISTSLKFHILCQILQRAYPVIFLDKKKIALRLLFYYFSILVFYYFTILVFYYLLFTVYYFKPKKILSHLKKNPCRISVGLQPALGFTFSNILNKKTIDSFSWNDSTCPIKIRKGY